MLININFFYRNKHIHIREGERDSNTKAQYKFHLNSKVMATFKEV